MNNELHFEITVVTVTYGLRWPLLQKALESAFREGVARVVVVDNAAKQPISALVHQVFDDKIQVLRLSHNTGSANGFKVGIEAAMAEGAELILLLDDDNVLNAGSLSALYGAYDELLEQTPQDRLAVLGFRSDHQADIHDGIPPERTIAHPNSFFGFHIADIPFKIWRRTPWAKRGFSQKSLPKRIRMEMAPYSGLMFHRKVVERIGTPDPKLVLYADDTEFSYRISASGGAIWLITLAGMTDLEASWNIKKRSSSSFGIWLLGDSDFRAYYNARNGAYFEHHCRPHSHWIRTVNRQIYLLALSLFARRLGRLDRYQLIKDAIADGEASRLGLHPRFPL